MIRGIGRRELILGGATMVAATIFSRTTIAEGSVRSRVVRIVAEHLDVDPKRVTSNARFVEDLGADSLDTVELVMAFEEEFGVEIPDDDAERITTVGKATRYLQTRAK